MRVVERRCDSALTGSAGPAIIRPVNTFHVAEVRAAFKGDRRVVMPAPGEMRSF